MKKILLLNPPGEQPYLRDYYCSKISKSGYLYHPTDLLLASGFLARHFEIKILDCIAEGLDDEQCLREAAAFAPDFVYHLTGSVSYRRDGAFMRRLRAALPGIKKVVGTGDVLFGDPKAKLNELDYLDAVCIDFTTEDLANYFLDRPCERIYRKTPEGVVGEWSAAKASEHFTVPVPRHDLFPNSRYAYPFARRNPFAVVLTNFGCPFKCDFCIMPSLGFKAREVENVLEELRFLKAHGFKNIYFNDQTFGANRGQTKRLLTAMADEDLTMGWVCFTRVDVLDEELLRLMRQAGCHTIMFGVESADPGILERHGKGITLDKVRAAVALCKKNKIRTLGTFIIGLPGETRETAEKTINFAKELPLDYAAFNIAIPRMGTNLREQVIKEKLVDPDCEEMDQSGSLALIPTGGMSLREIETLQKRAYKEFYLRPGKILQKLLDIRTGADLQNHVRNGLGVLKSLVSK